MAANRTLVSTALVAVGAGLLVFPFLPGAWPNPLAAGTELSAAGLQQLRAAAARVDAACAGGDVVALCAAISPAHRERLEKQLRAVDRGLDTATVRAWAAQRTLSYGDLLEQPLLASEVRENQVALVVRRADGGTQLVQFLWDGHALRLDDCREAVDAASAPRARAVAVDAVMPRD